MPVLRTRTILHHNIGALYHGEEAGQIDRTVQ